MKYVIQVMNEYYFNIFNKNRRKLSSCEIYEYDCSYEQETVEFECSKECSQKSSYYYSYCYSCPYKYDSKEGRCSENTGYNLIGINDNHYCFFSNIILYWKGLYYENISYEYSYINDAVLKNETCPDGKKPCGILDEYGNKLCVLRNEKCPINFISIGNEPPDKIHSYTPIKLDNQTIYYSNEFVERRIIKGLYSDSDFKINYNENCSILDTYNFSSFYTENKNIYRSKNIPYDIKINGKSYLKFCNSDSGKYNLDLIQLRNDYKLYQFSQKFNTDIYEKLKDKLSSEFFCSFFGCIYLLVYLFFSIWAMIYGKLNRSSLCCLWCFYYPYFNNDIIEFIIFFIFLIPYIVLSLLSTIWSYNLLNDLIEANNYPTIQSNQFEYLYFLQKLFILGNIIIYSLIFALFIFSILKFLSKKLYNSDNINYTKINEK